MQTALSKEYCSSRTAQHSNDVYVAVGGGIQRKSYRFLAVTFDLCGLGLGL